MGRGPTEAWKFVPKSRAKALPLAVPSRSAMNLSEKPLANRIRPPVPLRIGDRVYRLIAESERAETEPDGTHAARHREGDARPGVFRARDVGIARHLHARPGQLRQASRIVVHRGDVGGEGGVRAAQRLAAGAR